jgi:hypothetical protein
VAGVLAVHQNRLADLPWFGVGSGRHATDRTAFSVNQLAPSGPSHTPGGAFFR